MKGSQKATKNTKTQKMFFLYLFKFFFNNFKFFCKYSQNLTFPKQNLGFQENDMKNTKTTVVFLYFF